MMRQYDLIVIGAGTSGTAAALAGEKLGARVLLVEAGKPGGARLWDGDVPRKALIHSARTLHAAQNAAEFGVHVEKPRAIWSAIKLRVQDVRDDIRKLGREALAASGVELANGTARFVDDNLIEILADDDSPERLPRRAWGRKIIVATGSQAVVPAVPGLEEAGFLLPRDVYGLPSLPRSVAIIGGGGTGCEMAQALARLGAKVTLIEKSGRILPAEEPELSAYSLKILEGAGVQVLAGTCVLGAREDDEGKKLAVSKSGEESEVRASQILVAAGRAPRVEGLGLERTGAAWSERGIEADKYLRTDSKCVWAVGSVRESIASARASDHEGKAAARNALLPVPSAYNEKAAPSVVMLEPQLASVGLAEAEAGESRAVQIVREEFKNVDRAIIDGEAAGFCKLVLSRSGRVLGAQIAGPHAGELLPLLTQAVRSGAVASELSELAFAYPTASAILQSLGESWSWSALEDSAMKKAIKIAAHRV